MKIFLDRREVLNLGYITNSYNNKTIRLAIDSSKTNTAILIMNKYYTHLNVLELNGADDKEVLKLTKEQRTFLRAMFSGAKIVEVGIEDIITKKSKYNNDKYSEALSVHHSRFVLTSIYVSLIMCFQDYFNIEADPIPNQSWKHAVLPAEYNKKTVYKGSYDYVLETYGSKYLTGDKDKDNDVTDAMCIGEYMRIKAGFGRYQKVLELPVIKELSEYKYEMILVPTLPEGFSPAQHFIISESLDLKENATAISNRINKDEYGYSVIAIKDLSIEDIYSYSKGFSENISETAVLVVLRVT